MRSTQLALILLFGCIQATAQSLKADIDSTQALLKNQNVDERMATYYGFADRNRFADYDSTMNILKQYEEDAERNHRPHHANVARRMQFNLTYNSGQSKKAYEMLDGFIEKCDKEKSHDIYVFFIKNKIEFLIETEKTQTALLETKAHLSKTPTDDTPMLAMLYSKLGQIYQVVSNDSMSVLYLTKAIGLCKEAKDHNLTCNTYYDLCNALQQGKDFTGVLMQATDWWHTIDVAEQEEIPGFNARLRRALCLFMQGVAYYNIGDAENLHSVFTQMEKMTNNGTDLSTSLAEIKVYDLILSKKYDEALELTEQLIDFYNELAPMTNSVWIKEKAKIQYLRGDGADAYLSMVESNELEDIVNNYATTNQLNEFSTIYEVEQVKSHAKQLRLKLGFASSSALLLLILAIAIILYNRKLKHYIKVLCERIDAKNEQQNGKLSDTKSIAQAKASNNDNDSKLFNDIEKILSNDEILASTIDRDELARMAGTNRTYLTNCIHDVTGLSLTDFINTKRLDKAIELIKANTDMKITDISEAVGFASYTTFYRIFNKQYGVTPVDYRNYLLEKKA